MKYFGDKNSTDSSKGAGLGTNLSRVRARERVIRMGSMSLKESGDVGELD